MPKDQSEQIRSADKVKVGNPHYEPQKGLAPDPGGGVESLSAEPPKKRTIIPIRDKFTAETELMDLAAVLNSLPEAASKVTRFSARVGSPSAGKWTLLLDVAVETDEEYADLVKQAIHHSSFKIR